MNDTRITTDGRKFRVENVARCGFLWLKKEWRPFAHFPDSVALLIGAKIPIEFDSRSQAEAWLTSRDEKVWQPVKE